MNRSSSVGTRVRVRHRQVTTIVAALAILVGSFAFETPSAEAGSLPACRIADVLTKWSAPADWGRTLVDTTYRVRRSYRPTGLVSVASAGLSGGGSIRRVALADLRAMVRASRIAGARLAVESAYRSYATQVWTFAYWARVGGRASALATSARPGHSEHQLGVAIDFKTAGRASPWRYGDWARTREGAWLARNAWRYGFVMSYPAGKRSLTCYAYEPWHYRYVGRDLARQVHDSRRTLRQVLWSLQDTPVPTPTPTGTPEPTPTGTPEGTPTEAPTPTPTGTQAPTPTEEPTPTESPTPTAAPPEPPTPTEAPTPTPTAAT